VFRLPDIQKRPVTMKHTLNLGQREKMAKAIAFDMRIKVTLSVFNGQSIPLSGRRVDLDQRLRVVHEHATPTMKGKDR